MIRITAGMLAAWLGFFVGTPLAAQPKATFPSSAEVQALLQKEPITDASWPAWKQRLTEWFPDMTRGTDEAYRAAERYVANQADSTGHLPARFDNDHLAWYFLGGSFLHKQPPAPEDLERAEAAYRRCIAIDPKFARGHRNLATALIFQVAAPKGDVQRLDALTRNPRLTEAEREIKETVRLDPQVTLSGIDGMLAQKQGQFQKAIAIYERALLKEPDQVAYAQSIADCALADRGFPSPSVRIKPLVERFPNDAVLAALYAVGLALDNDMRGAFGELQRVRALGGDPARILSPAFVEQIEAAGKPGLLDWYLKVMMWFGIVYAALMLAMAGAGLVLAMLTRGTHALDLLQKQPADQLVTDGKVARVQQETVLARLYGFALMIGLILFYAAIPFVIAGLLGGTAVLLYLMFTSMSRIPIKLVLIIVVVGGVGAWAVFKSLFTKPATGGFGVLKTSEQCPHLYELLGEVSRRVDTAPVDDVYLSPGSAIGVHQEGRGPFGMFGVNKRVLTLGFCTLRFLTVGELKAILAHEYAHFSHADTFYSRFIYQVHMSIQEALYGMMSSGGYFNYVNPFYWFLWLYYKSYSLLAAGYSRSREFLADRMAATLYGAKQFTTALEKVSTDGSLFEMTIYDNISSLLNEQKEYVNMYEAFAEYRNQQMTGDERAKLSTNLLGEKGSVFASHPTFAERAEAIKTLPAEVEVDDRPALALFENADELEKELTRFLTDYMAYIHQLQALAAQQQG